MVITDMVMRKKGGLDVLRTLQETAPFVPDHRDVGWRPVQAAQSVGVTVVLRKPFGFPLV